MKNEDIKKVLLKETLVNTLFKIIIWTIIILFLSNLLLVLINVSDFNWVYNYSPTIYYFFKNIFNTTIFNIIIIFIIWLIGTSLIIYQVFKKNYLYLEAIYQAISLLTIPNTDICLPKELNFLEHQMNRLKRENEKNEQLARESEQRKNDLIIYLAHDLKTPLTSIIGYLSLVDEIKDMPKKKQQEYIKIALDKSYHLEELINELFEIARFNSEEIILEKNQINLKLMLEQILDDFYPVLKEYDKKINLNINKNLTIIGDSNQLARVFSNIIKNAINYSTDKEITIDVENKKDLVTVIVSNKGDKIPPYKLNKLFEKFYRVDEARNSKNGSGLGLAIAKEIVEKHGGYIKATSDDNYTKIYVTLPIKN